MIASRFSGNAAKCPLCDTRSSVHTLVDGVAFYDCRLCDFVFAHPDVLDLVDRGQPLRQYDEAYWKTELASARDRSFGSSLARVAEAILYTQIPIDRFIDIGTGPGYLLDAISRYLPQHSHVFFGVEKYPPIAGCHTTHPNYICSDVSDLVETFQCGTCVEVLEHLTPSMARQLARSLANISTEGSLFLFNTGLTEYVKREDPAYLDPYGRGHITCWSVTAARGVFSKVGFNVYPLKGKAWAFILEFGAPTQQNMEDRIWSSPDRNKALLHDDEMGRVMYILGLESARAYLHP